MPKGCYTCRRRRVKCDNNLPFCQKCQNAGIECLGYQKPLVWVKGGVASRGKMMGLTFGEITESGNTDSGNTINTRDHQEAPNLMQLSSASNSRMEGASLPLKSSSRPPEGAIGLGIQEPLPLIFHPSPLPETLPEGMKLLPMGP